MVTANSISFRMMSLVHETLYGLLRDPYAALAAAGLAPGQRILEVGSGPGFFTLPAAKIAGEKGSVLSLDVNPVAVEHVRAKLAKAGVSNAQTRVTDAAHTGEPDQSFDLVFLFGLGRVIGGIETIWPELHRILKPGGTLSVEGRLQPPRRLFLPLKRQGRITQYQKIE